MTLKQLEELLAKLEQLWRTQGCQYFCVIPTAEMPPSHVALYAWPASERATEVSESIRTGSRLFVAARNISLHKYIVKFRITSESSHVNLQRSPTSTPEPTFSGELKTALKPPIRSSGVPVCIGCGLTVDPTFDPTVVLRCDFNLVYEDVASKVRSRNIVVTLSQ